MIELKSRIKRADGTIETEVDGSRVLMSIELGKYYGLNEVASTIWEKMENPLAVEDLINQLLEEYDIDERSCTEQVLKYLEDLEKNCLLSIL